MTITGRQKREARVLLKLDHSRLATRVKVVTKATIVRAEAVDGEPSIKIAQASAIRGAMERAGIEFLPETGSVRLRNPNA